MSKEQVPNEPIIRPTQFEVGLEELAQIPIPPHIFSSWAQGNFLSTKRGPGIEPDGVRPYQPGDDPRFIDHAATARHPLGEIQYREHFQETTPSFLLISDVALQRHTITPGRFTEQELSLSAVMALLLTARGQGLPTGHLVVSDTQIGEKWLHGPGLEHILQAGQEINALLPSPIPMPMPKRRLFSRRHEDGQLTDPMTLETALQKALRQCAGQVIAIVSDFREHSDLSTKEEPHLQPYLQQLFKQGNDILAVEITNPEDRQLPAQVDRVMTSDGPRWITDEGRRIYSRNAEIQQRVIDDMLGVVTVAHIKLDTDEPKWLTALVNQLSDAVEKSA